MALDTARLHTEHLEILPKRLETKKISIGNVNVAVVGQSNHSGQLMGLGIVAAQLNAQSNGAYVNQRN